MSVRDFRSILKFFGGSQPTPEEQEQLFKEAAMMALARATSADTNIKQVELEHVQDLMREATGEVLDPHTAVGVKAAAEARGDPATPMVVLGTAHAAKFPDAMEKACGVRPELPPRMADLYERAERVTVVPNDLSAIEKLIREGVRA